MTVKIRMLTCLFDEEDVMKAIKKGYGDIMDKKYIGGE